MFPIKVFSKAKKKLTALMNQQKIDFSQLTEELLKALIAQSAIEKKFVSLI
jgi:hypothetical protein